MMLIRPNSIAVDTLRMNEHGKPYIDEHGSAIERLTFKLDAT